MYGPPADSRQQLAPVEIFDIPEVYLSCFALGLLLSILALWRRPPTAVRAAVFIAGQTIILTAPLAFLLDDWVYGSFPTIDKAGSMAFYLDGVHERMMSDPLGSFHDPAARLIGVHIGHLWVTAFFDIFVSPMGAFNAQALLYPALAWFSAWLLFREVTGNPRVSLLMAFPFGMGLHVFRDLNWYTIEKAAIFWVPLFLYFCLRAWKYGGRDRWLAAAVLVLSTWMNIYLGMLNAMMMGFSALALWMSGDQHRRRFLGTCCVAALALSPLAIWQWSLMQGGSQLASPEAFLWERAALDSFSISPFRWNRLEVHRSLNVVALGVAFWGLRRSRWVGAVRLGSMAALLFFMLSLGPIINGTGLENPIYMATRAVVPGFWRVAKPEVFFHLTWLMLLVSSPLISMVSGGGAPGPPGLLYEVVRGPCTLVAGVSKSLSKRQNRLRRSLSATEGRSLIR